jgi:hypothetical protein
MSEQKVTHHITLSQPIKAILWGFVIAIALNAIPMQTYIADAEAQISRSGTYSQPIYINCLSGCN